MSENEKYTIKEMVSKLSEKVETLESDVRSDIKELTSMFSKYMITNNDRISLLEGKQKVTTKTIAIYLGFIGMFIMLAINTYMSFKG